MLPLSRTTAALIIVLALPSADAQPRHPDYRRALADLRLARHLLNAPGEYRVVEDQRRAVGRINTAVRDIEQAGTRDRQNLAWRGPADVPRIRADRFRQARAAVVSALRDIETWEANRNAAAWQGRAVRDLNEALQFLDLAIQDREGLPRSPR